jgi:hypothetical protein
MKLHFKNANIKNINITMVFGTPPVTACVIFATYEMLVGRLAATMAFTTLSLFNILRFPLVVLPKALRSLSEALASIARIEAFLLEHVPTDAEGISKASRPGISIVSVMGASSVGLVLGHIAGGSNRAVRGCWEQTGSALDAHLGPAWCRQSLESPASAGLC